MALTVFKDFKDCLNGHISTTTDPNIYFDKVFDAYACIKAANVAVPSQLQVMIALTALSQKWEMLISIITGDNTREDLILSDVHTIVIMQFQVDSVCHGSGKHNANKISVVKHKHGNLNWHNQQGSNQQGSNQQQQQNQWQQGSDSQAKCKCSKCAGKGKAKQANQSQQHSHIANITSMAPPTHSTIALSAPSGMHKHTVTRSTPKQHMPSPYRAFNAAVNTTEASGSKLTIQMVKTLKQCITNTYLESLWAKVAHISDIEDSNIEMHALQGKEDQGNWIFEEADEETGQQASQGEEANPSFKPLSPLAKLLDWRSVECNTFVHMCLCLCACTCVCPDLLDHYC